jgi:hypothetical protein
MQDWFAQGLADLPADPTYGVPFMVAASLVAVIYLYLFFSREARLGRLGPGIQRTLAAVRAPAARATGSGQTKREWRKLVNMHQIDPAAVYDTWMFVVDV